jgi:putative phage-type endonuclease
MIPDTSEVSPEIVQLRAERQLGLGGSDAGRYMGIAAVGCPRSVAYEKIGTPVDAEVDKPFTGNSATERGQIQEPVAASIYAKKTGRKLWVKPAAKFHKEYPFLLVHMDRMILSLKEGDINPTFIGKGPGILEIKCPGKEAWQKYFGDEGSGIPDSYYYQVQHALMVTGYQWGSFAIFCADLHAFRYWDVPRDEELIQSMLKQGTWLWNECVLPGVLPERLDDPLDKRCKKCTWKYTCRGSELQEKFGSDYEETAEFDETLAPVLSAYKAEKSKHKRAARELKRLDEDIRRAMGDRTNVACTAGTVFYRPQKRGKRTLRVLKVR